MSEYFDKEGNPITMLEWAKKSEDKEYKIICQEILPNGKFISTVWLGLNHNFGIGAPLIFETMVFSSKGDWREEDCERYSSLEEAQKGHERMIEKWKYLTKKQ